MARGKLTIHEQELIGQNENVERVTETQVFYKEKFKKHFIEEYKKGKNATEIFSAAGFDISILGAKRIERAASRWKEAAGIKIADEKRRGTKAAHQKQKEKLVTQLKKQKERTSKMLEKKNKKIAELEAELKLLKKTAK